MLYFADVDRTGYVLKTVDLITEEWDIVTDIDQHPDYSVSNGFDFMQVVDDVTKDNYQAYWSIGITITIILDNFWTTQNSCGTPYYNSNLDCVQDCTEKKRRFWIAWSSITVEGVPATGC